MKGKINRLILLVCLTFACVIGFAACNLVTAVDFKLQFIVDGEIYATIDTAGEETIRLPDDPEKDGYLFDGWYWDEDTWERPFTANSLLNEKLTSDMSVYAKWKDVESEAQQYVVTFDSAGGSSIDSVTVSESGLLAEPSKPTKTGYVFVGWYKDADLNTEWNFAADTVTENIVLYAKWVDESDAAGCDILTADGFETEGNNLSIKVSNEQEYFALSQAIVVSPYAKWTVTSDIAGNSEIPSATVSLAEGDNTYYINVVSGNGLNKKQYTVEIRRREIYTVTYQFNNGFADVTEQVEEDGKALAKSAEKTGYTLDCWKSDGSVWDFENDIVASNITLAANWTANIYNVTFESNGGGTIAASTATYDANFTFAVPARTGYTFNGWETEGGAKLTDGEGRSLAAWNIAAETKLYADWSATEYSVVYKNTDGATNTNPVKYTVEDATITLADAQKTGYIFLGWYSDEGLTKKVERIDTSSVSNVVLWAKWDIIEYTATFKDGITVVGEVITFTVETDAITEPAVPEHTGYIGAWESYTLGTENITINAVYIPIAYTITYENTKGATNSNATNYTIESDTIMLLDIAAEGYTFEGWFDDSDQKVTEIAAGTYGNIILTAKWMPVEYSITYENTKGVVNSNATIYTIESDTITFVFISADGYTFDGWYEDGQEVTEIAKGSFGNKTLTAQWTAIEYTITYENTKGASNSNPAKYTIESDTIALAELTMDGYTFDGWYEGGQEVTEIAKGSFGNKTLTAQWTAIEYTITYENTKGASNSNPAKYTIESDTIALAELTMDGYTFDGWYEGGQEVTEIAKGSFGNKTLTAQWIAIEYTIIYENTKGASNANPAKYTIESDTIALAELTVDGYSFNGWYDGGKKVTEIAAGSFGNKTFTAKWTTIEYAISFIMENEEGGYDGHYADSENPEKYTIEDEFTFISPVCDIRGYEFKGWYTQKQGGEKVEKLEKGTTGAKTYYAQWQRQEYSINYYNIETAIDSNPDSYNVDTETFSLTSPTKKGYEFAGWYSDAKYTTSVNGTVEKGSIGDLQFYAKWEKEIYSITYVLYDGENNGANPAEYTIEDSIELQEPTKEGYTFGGWFKDSAYTIPKGQIENETGNLTLYAKWYYIGTITFETNGGTAIAPIKQEYGTVLTAPQDPTKEHYTFAGWYSDETLTQKYIFSTMPDRNFTLYAKWIPAVYKITYILNGGVNDGSNPVTYTYESETITLQPATKLGYEFIGWFKDAEFTSAVQEEIVKGSYGDIELYANFRIKEYTISFESNGGNTVTSITQNYGTKVSEPAAPSKTGYQFGGWYKNSALTQKYAFTTMPAEDITLYAKWNRITYTISYNLEGGTNSFENPANYTIESSDIVLASPVKNGYAFKGWYSDSGFTTQIQTIPTGSHGDISVFAKWQAIEYSITYIGAENAENNNPAKYTIEDSITLVAAEKSGYTFDGWFDDVGYSNKVTQIAAGTTGDKTFYAKFMPAVYEVWLDGYEGASYTVTFNLMGGSGSIVAQTVTETVALAYPAQNPTKSGFAFAGWYDNAECTSEAFDFSGSVTSDITLYAKWISVTNTVIEMNTNISVDIDGMREHVYDFVPTVSGNVTITTTGSADTFGYLYNAQGDLLASDDDSGNGGINFQLVYNVTAGEKYTVKVRGYSEKTSGTTELSLAGSAAPADGGTALETKRVEITFGREFSLPVPTERIGYNFLGWYDAKGRQFSGGDGIGLFDWDVAEDTVLYSKWSKVEFTVTFITNNGSPVDTVTLFYGARLDLSQYVTTRSGYTFTGWYLNQTDTDPYNATTMPNANLTLYAKWITYNLNNLKYDETKTAVSVNDTLNAELFNAICFDTDGKQVSVSVTYSGSFAAGETITVRLTASSNGKNAIKTITGIKVYGAPTLLYDTEKDYINLSDTLNATLFDASGTDSFNEATTIRVFTEDDYDAGDSITVVIQSVDPAGNITEQKIQNIKVYGSPEIAYDQTVTGIKETDDITAALFGVTGATDSFGEPLEFTVTLYRGTQEAGNTVTVRLSATDSKGNVCNIDLNINVYGEPTINFPTNTNIKFGSDITPELLGLTGYDSHGGEVSFSFSTEDVLAAGEIVTYTVTATDYLGNTSIKTFQVKIYGKPTFSYREGINYNEIVSAITLQAKGTDSFGEYIPVSIELVSGTLTAGTKITVRLSATDASGTLWSVEKQIGVYDPADICLTYSAGMTDSIKLTSNGEEFDANATDSFGEACSLSVRRADGGKLVAGAMHDIVIIATDKAGNTKSSETIANIKVYGIPTVALTDPDNGYTVQEGTDISFLFIVLDSFGQELYAEITADVELVAGEIVNITVRATDSVGNVLKETFEVGVLPSEQTLVTLFIEGNLWKSEFVTENCISVPSVAQDMLFYGWVDESGVRYTDGEGILLKNISSLKTIQLHAVFEQMISTISALKNIQLDGRYILNSDIDLRGAEWTPLGTSSLPFTGVFNGNGFKISNFKITIDYEYVGFFGYNSGTIKNLGVENITINVKGRYVGGLVGYNCGDIICSYAACTVSSSYYVGGLVGYNTANITNSYAIANVSLISSDSDNAYAGGLVGYNDFGTVTNSYSTGSLSVSSFDNAYVGGLVGYNDSGTITNSYATGNVSASSSDSAYVGGLVSYNISGVVAKSYATGNVSASCSGTACAGGLVGYNFSGDVGKSYATGNVSASINFNSSSAYAGGLVGYNLNGNVMNSYAMGEVSATTRYSSSSVSFTVYAGGLVGCNNKGVIIDCYELGYVSTSGDVTYTGGVAGSNYLGIIKNSYAMGDVNTIIYNGAAYIGGLVGDNYIANKIGEITNCYRYSGQTFTVEKDSSISHEPFNTLGTEKDLVDLQSASFHTSTLGWDSAVWNIVEGEFPTLKNVGVIW